MSTDESLKVRRGAACKREPMEDVKGTQFFHDGKRLLLAARGSFVRSRQQLICSLAHGRYDHNWTPIFEPLDDFCDARNSFLRFDGCAAELHYDHREVLINKAFGDHELGVQNGCPGCTTNGVVPTSNELDPEHRAFTQATNESGHSVFTASVATGLGPVLLRHVHDGRRRSTGERAFLWKPTKPFD